MSFYKVLEDRNVQSPATEKIGLIVKIQKEAKNSIRKIYVIILLQNCDLLGKNDVGYLEFA